MIQKCKLLFLIRRHAVITLALLSFADFYFIDSQPELDRKYSDILLIGSKDGVEFLELINTSFLIGAMAIAP